MWLSPCGSGGCGLDLVGVIGGCGLVTLLCALYGVTRVHVVHL